MQLKMEETEILVKSPDVEQTPLEKEETLKTSKSDKNISEPNLKVDQEQQQKQTPQKDKKQRKKKRKRKNNKTHQNTPSSPKTQEGQSMGKSLGMNPDKKQKLNDTTSEIVEPESTLTNCKDSYTITVIFPKGPLPANEILPVYEGCKEVTLNQNRTVVLSYDSCEDLEKRVEELQKITFDSRPLTVFLKKSNVSLLKKAIYLPSAEHQEEARKFFNAKSIDFIKSREGFSKIYHVLSFETEEEAEIAASKKFVLNGERLALRPYFEKFANTNPKGTKKWKEAKWEKIQQIQKPENVKRKDEDSYDEEAKELEGDDMMEGIDMND